jgi:hypothetical protein
MTHSIRYIFEGDDLPDGHLLAGQTWTFDIEADVSPYDPGCTYGPPENCYPPEGGEIDITEIELIEPKMPDEEQKKVVAVFREMIDVDPKLRERIEEKLFEASQSDDREWDD